MDEEEGFHLTTCGKTDGTIAPFLSTFRVSFLAFIPPSSFPHSLFIWLASVVGCSSVWEQLTNSREATNLCHILSRTQSNNQVMIKYAF